MSKSTRMTPEQLLAMGLEEFEEGKYRPIKKEYYGGIDPVSDNPSGAVIFKRLADGTSEALNIDKIPFPYSTEDIKNYTSYAKPKIYLGIDPGKSGAIAFVDPEGKLHKYVIPIAGSDIDGQELYNILDTIRYHYTPTVILEDVHSLFGMSAASNFSFGFVCGMIRAMVIANSLPIHMVAPKTWQKLIWLNDDKVYKPKKPEQKNPSIDTKATTLKAVRRIFPTFDLTKNQRAQIPHDGIVDAIALSEYGRRLNL